MRLPLLLLPLAVLSACATPREQCIDNATRDTRILSGLVAETRGTLSRGYALEDRQNVRTITTLCQGQNEDGETFSFPCSETETVTTTVPVAVDLNAEADKLEQLEVRLAQSQRVSDQAVLQCIQLHPE